MINIPKGTKDVLPAESYRWHYVEAAAREVARLFQLREIRTPVFEHTELFLRGVGETTDVVTKEMYTFEDKGGRSMTLKPEGTAGVARSYVENGLANAPQPVKMYYLTPVFRYERPQAGRLREHHQFGVEIYGAEGADTDAEVIAIAKTLMERLGVTGLKLFINSIGCPECRAKYNAALREYLAANLGNMCGTCRERFEKNPLRILDCKEPACIEINRSAPEILSFLCPDCAAHFAALQESLTLLGIPFEANPRIVRGLDYYTRTVFEFVSTDIGAQGTVCGGGRYDGLVQSIGGRPTPAVGFGMGLERLLLTLDNLGVCIPNEEIPEVIVINAEENAYPYCYRLVAKLRAAGVSADADHMRRGFKAQLKYADKLGAKFTVIVGGAELAAGTVQFKNMESGEQQCLTEAELIAKMSEGKGARR